jgi:hypothetical protein
VWASSAQDIELQEAWVEGDLSARWRSGKGHGPVYAGVDVVTRYEEEIQPHGQRERSPVAR